MKTKSKTDKIDSFLKISGMFIASLWGGYTFFYKELWIPNNSPINITMNLQLKKIGQPLSEVRSKNSELVAIKMIVSATNSSSRKTYLLPSIWKAYGYRVNSLHENANFSKDVDEALKSGDLVFIEKHASKSPLSTVVVGRAFLDDSISPNETVSQENVFHVPLNQYDVIKVQVSIPHTPQGNVTASWSYENQKSAVVSVMYFINENGERKEIEKDKDGSYSNSSKKYEVYTAETSASLSLWQ
jgi:hypothetical protein